MGNKELTGQVAVVTGASRGIGRAIARAFAREGASVVCVARSSHALDVLVDEINAEGGDAVRVSCDVTDRGSVQALGAAVEEQHGVADIVVNNAGVYRARRFLDYSLQDFREVFEVNVFGVVAVTQALLPLMLERDRGRVINVASTAGKYGSLFQSAYNASKHALVGLTRCLALETASSGVRVNAICPGFVDTDMVDQAVAKDLAPILNMTEQDVVAQVLQRVPIRRMIQPSEVAAMAVYLASPGADGITGQAFTISGGLILT